MKIVEALKEMKHTLKKINGKQEQIVKYSSMLSTERPYFNSEEDQKKEVKQLIQGVQDLITRYLELKRKVELTNLKTKIQFEGVNYSISDLLVLKRKLGQEILKTYSCLSDTSAMQRLRGAGVGIDGKTPQVVRFYSEQEKNENIRFWQDLLYNVESRLEVVNATTDLNEE